MSHPLPTGWASAPLDALVTAQKGKKPDTLRRDQAPGFVPYLDIHAIEQREVRQFADVASSRLARESDLLVVWDGARSGWVGSGACGAIGSTIMALTSCGAEPLYLLHFITSQFDSVNTNTRGTGIPHVDPEFFWKLEVPVAPSAEQKRIVEKLKPLLGKVDACQRRLTKIPRLLKRFRQSVLAAACAGRLTADWRKLNPEAETAENLINNPTHDIAEPEQGLGDLPDRWAWVALGNYARCSRGRFSVRPRNDPSCFGGEYPFIQIGNLNPDGGWVRTHTQTLNAKGLAVSKKFPKGTVVIAIVGATIGNTGLLAYDMCFPDSLVGLETGTPEGNRFVELFLRDRKHDIRQASYSSGGQPNIKLEFLNPYPLALPPLLEQREIVRRVDQLFAFADQLEARFAKAQTHVDKLTQSLLAKVFRGELVPQDPNDEPASKLLARIRSETDKAPKPKRTRAKAIA